MDIFGGIKNVWHKIFPESEEEKELNSVEEALEISEGYLTNKVNPSDNMEDYNRLLERVKKDNPAFDLTDNSKYEEEIKNWHTNTLNNIKPLQLNIQVKDIEDDYLKDETKNTLLHFDSTMQKEREESLPKLASGMDDVVYGSRFLEDLADEFGKKTIEAGSRFAGKYATQSDKGKLIEWNRLSREVFDDIKNDVRSGVYNPKEISFSDYTQQKLKEGDYNMEELLRLSSEVEEISPMQRQFLQHEGSLGRDILNDLAGIYGHTLGRAASGLQQVSNIAGRKFGAEGITNEIVKNLDNERRIRSTDNLPLKGIYRVYNGGINVLENAPEVLEVAVTTLGSGGTALATKASKLPVITTFLKNSPLAAKTVKNAGQLAKGMEVFGDKLSKLDKALKSTSYLGKVYEGGKAIPMAVPRNLVSNLSFANAFGSQYTPKDFLTDWVFDGVLESVARGWKHNTNIEDFSNIEKIFKEAEPVMGQTASEFGFQGAEKRIQDSLNKKIKEANLDKDVLQSTERGRNIYRNLLKEAKAEEGSLQFARNFIENQEGAVKVMEKASKNTNNVLKTDKEKSWLIDPFLRKMDSDFKKHASDDMLKQFQDIDAVINSKYNTKKRVFDKLLDIKRDEITRMKEDFLTGKYNFTEELKERKDLLADVIKNKEDKSAVLLLHNLVEGAKNNDPTAKKAIRAITKSKDGMRSFLSDVQRQGGKGAKGQRFNFETQMTPDAKKVSDIYDEAMEKANINKGIPEEQARKGAMKEAHLFGIMNADRADLLEEGGKIGARAIMPALFTDVDKAFKSTMRAMRKNIIVQEIAAKYKEKINPQDFRNFLEGKINELKRHTIGEGVDVDRANKFIGKQIDEERKLLNNFDNKVKKGLSDKEYVNESLSMLDSFKNHLTDERKNINIDLSSRTEAFSKAFKEAQKYMSPEDIDKLKKGLRSMQREYAQFRKLDEYAIDSSKGIVKTTDNILSEAQEEKFFEEIGKQMKNKTLTAKRAVELIATYEKKDKDFSKVIEKLDNYAKKKYKGKDYNSYKKKVKAVINGEIGQSRVSKTVNRKLEELNEESFDVDKAKKLFSGMDYVNEKGEKIKTLEIEIGQGFINMSQTIDLFKKLSPPKVVISDEKKAELFVDAVSKYTDATRRQILPEDKLSMQRAFYELMRKKDVDYKYIKQQYDDIALTASMNSTLKTYMRNNDFAQDAIKKYNAQIEDEILRIIEEEKPGFLHRFTRGYFVSGIDMVRKNPLLKKVQNGVRAISAIKEDYLKPAIKDYVEPMGRIKDKTFLNQYNSPINLRKTLEAGSPEAAIIYLRDVEKVDIEKITDQDIEDLYSVLSRVKFIGDDFVRRGVLKAEKDLDLFPEKLARGERFKDIEKKLEGTLGEKNLNQNITIATGEGKPLAGEEALRYIVENDKKAETLLKHLKFQPMLDKPGAINKAIMKTRGMWTVLFEWTKFAQQMLHPAIDFMNKEFAFKYLNDNGIKLFNKEDINAFAKFVQEVAGENMTVPVQRAADMVEAVGNISSASTYEQWWKKLYKTVPEEYVNELVAQVLTFQSLQITAMEVLGHGKGLGDLRKMYDNATPLFKKEIENRMKRVINESYIDTMRKLGTSANDPLMRVGLQSNLWLSFMKIWRTKMFSKLLSDVATPISKFIRSGDTGYLKEMIASREVMEMSLQILTAMKMTSQAERYREDHDNIDFKRGALAFNPTYLGATTAISAFIPDNFRRKFDLENGMSVEDKIAIFLTDVFEQMQRNIAGAETAVLMAMLKTGHYYSHEELKKEKGSFSEAFFNILLYDSFKGAIPPDRSVRKSYGFEAQSVVDDDTANVLSLLNEPKLSEDYLNETVLTESLYDQLSEEYKNHKKNNSNVAAFAFNRAWNQFTRKLGMFGENSEYSYRNNIMYERMKTMIESDPVDKLIREGKISEAILNEGVNWRDIKAYVKKANEGLGSGLIPTANLEFLGISNIIELEENDLAVIANIDDTEEWQSVMNIARKLPDYKNTLPKDKKKEVDAAFNQALDMLSGKIGSKAIASRFVLAKTLSDKKAAFRKMYGTSLPPNLEEEIEKWVCISLGDSLVRDVTETGEEFINNDFLGDLRARHFYRQNVLDKIPEDREISEEDRDNLRGYATGGIGQLAKLYLTVDLLKDQYGVIPENMLTYYAVQSKALQNKITDTTPPEVISEYAQSMYNISKFIKKDDQLSANEKEQMIEGVMLANLDNMDKTMNTPYGELTEHLNQKELTELATMLYSDSTEILDKYKRTSGAGGAGGGISLKNRASGIQQLRLSSTRFLAKMGVSPRLSQPAGISFNAKKYQDFIASRGVPERDIVEIINPKIQDEARKFINEPSRRDIRTADLTTKDSGKRKPTSEPKRQKIKFKFKKPKQ